MYNFEALVKAFPPQPGNAKSAKTSHDSADNEENKSLAKWMQAAHNPNEWHVNTLRAVGHLISKKLSDTNIHALLDEPLTLAGNMVHQTNAEIQVMIDGAREKPWGAKGDYDAGDVGPLPIGFARDQNFALRDQRRNIIICATSNQLLSQQYLLGLANSSFWAEKYPSQKGLFNAYGAGEGLIEACLKAGPFDPLTVRGRGVWLEGNREIINLGSPVPTDTDNLYLCFKPIPIPNCDQFDTRRLLDFVEKFNWRNPQDAFLWLGWIAAAPICGVLKRRPHCFVYGPPKCGKTTLHDVVSEILQPLVITADGQSSEAGIRQTLGPDSLPIVIDEFESDHNQGRLRSVIKLARSAYSADTSLLRGTPEGKAMQFSLRTSFYLSAVNPVGMEPADETRFIMLELVMHDNDPFTARLIAEEEEYFADRGPEWCAYMVGLAGKINPAIKTFRQVMPGMDMRHCENMATLLAGAFVALHGREPSVEEAQKLAMEYAATVNLHGEVLDRDDTQECLNHLYAHVIELYPLWHWIAKEYAALKMRSNDIHRMSRRILSTIGIKVNAEGDDAGLYLLNGSPAIEKIFANTKWAGRAWQRALRKIAGSSSPKAPVYFPSIRGKARCVMLPLEVIPEPMDQPEPPKPI